VSLGNAMSANEVTVKSLPRMITFVVVSYFIAFTGLCWFLYIGSHDKHEIQSQRNLLFDAGAVTGLLTLICLVLLWRSHRRLAVTGLLACLLWAIWAALPRL
jgi:hypothetical protein